MTRIWAFLAAFTLVFCFLAAGHNASAPTTGPFETTSLLGRKLYGLPDDDGSIKAAKEKLQTSPHDVTLILQLSKAQAAKRQYKEAVATSTSGIAFASNDADLFLERGHRELGLREFQAALNDLNRAVELNPRQLDSFYHLGLSHYFLGQYGEAAEAFQNALNLAQSSDSVIDCSNWLYVSLQRAGQKDQASRVLSRITPDVTNKEPHLLFYLRLLHFYQGGVSEKQILPPKPSSPSDIEGELQFDTTNYGVGNWHLYHNDPTHARDFFRNVVTGYAWNAWGFIGSEVELSKNHS